jgi:hypothetical protein
MYTLYISTVITCLASIVAILPDSYVRPTDITSYKPTYIELTSEVTDQPLPEIPQKMAVFIAPVTHIQLMQKIGIPEDQWSAVDYILTRESGWCALKWQGQIGYCPGEYTELHSPSDGWVGFGLCQSTPAIKMETIGKDWRTSAETQLKWCNQYALTKYGSWNNAKAYWMDHRNW